MRYQVVYTSYQTDHEQYKSIVREVEVVADKWSSSYGRTVFVRDFVDTGKDNQELTLPVAEFPTDNIWSIIAIVEEHVHEDVPEVTTIETPPVPDFLQYDEGSDIGDMLSTGGGPG